MLVMIIPINKDTIIDAIIDLISTLFLNKKNPVKNSVENVFVDTEGVAPIFSHS